MHCRIQSDNRHPPTGALGNELAYTKSDGFANKYFVFGPNVLKNFECVFPMVFANRKNLPNYFC